MINSKVIELRNVEVTYREKRNLFTYDEHTALRDISFDVYRGETLGIIGRNGAGKSTLLRVLAGIIKPDGGTISIHTKSVSLMALQAGFDPNLSGRQNTIISGMLLGHRLSHIKSLIEDIKEYSELNDFFEKPIKNYSSGMLARLGFSIAMYTTPEVLLIDEVLGVGDITFAEKAQQSIREKIKSDTTVIIVSHDEAQLKLLSDRLVCIEDGIVVAEGLSDPVYIKYNLIMKLTSYGLCFIEYDNNQNIALEIDEINVQDDYSDIRFIVEGDIDELTFDTTSGNSGSILINDRSCWMRIFHRDRYNITFESSDNIKTSLNFSIDFS